MSSTYAIFPRNMYYHAIQTATCCTSSFRLRLELLVHYWHASNSKCTGTAHTKRTNRKNYTTKTTRCTNPVHKHQTPHTNTHKRTARTDLTNRFSGINPRRMQKTTLSNHGQFPHRRSISSAHFRWRWGALDSEYSSTRWGRVSLIRFSLPRHFVKNSEAII